MFKYFNSQKFVYFFQMIKAPTVLDTKTVTQKEVFCKKRVLRNFATFTGKHL